MYLPAYAGEDLQATVAVVRLHVGVEVSEMRSDICICSREEMIEDDCSNPIL
jgi:hypothetical protein